jgi:wyosine [tRNA(Phe)-imidazoG37] synthetase (radical SAM superfamily)
MGCLLYRAAHLLSGQDKMYQCSPDEIKRLIINSASEGNILPITSRCDSHCIFCSHHNNPPEINVISIGVLTLEEISETISFLNPDQVITIGESASTIIEGEPFTHPKFREIIVEVRRHFPFTPVDITTNGRYLSREMIHFLEIMGNISLFVSLNSASVRGRALLMGDSEQQSERTLEGIKLLADSKISFSGSMVAMPNITGWDDLRDTVKFLAEHKATAVRIFMPGFSSKAKPGVFPDEDRIYAELRGFIDLFSPDLSCPVLIEPSQVADLTPVVSGVLKDSPAWDAGMRRGDIIVTINKEKPRCRVEAWNMLFPKGSITAELKRDGHEVTAGWINKFPGGSGITMEYDFDPARAESIRESILGCQGKSLLLTSEFGYAVVCKVLELMDIGRDRAEPVMVKNIIFGGTIRAAGLLTVEDYNKSYIQWRESNPEPSQIIVPLESFNSLGFDLKHIHHSELQKMTGIPIILK